MLSPFAAPDTVFSEGFEGDISATWTTEAPTTRGRARPSARRGSFSLADSPGANYLNNTDSFARTTNAFSLAGRTDCALAYELRLATQQGDDGLIIERSTNAVDWTGVRC